MAGDCPRAGKVHFSFFPTATGLPFQDLGTFQVFTQPGNAFLSPGDTGEAGTGWTPTASGQGYVVAAITCDPSPCQQSPTGQCNGIPENPYAPYTVQKQITIAATAFAAEALRHERRQALPGSIFFGFGVVASRADTRLTARAIRSGPDRGPGANRGLSVPRVQLAVTQPQNAQGLPFDFRSGLLVPRSDFDASLPFSGDEGGVSRIVRPAEQTQGLLQVTFAAPGDRAVIRVDETDLDGKLLGHFVIGLANVPNHEKVI
ncbi:MAG: hypothetical protein JOZ69_18195, partial [Myxococcales bacterium]|nr:hypothetical protein [Myxococcales bacterium]